MNFEEEFFGSFITIIASAAIIGALFFALMIAPFIGLAAVPVIGFLAYRHSPQVKELQAYKHTYELYERAANLAPPDGEAIFARLVDELGSVDSAETAYAIFVFEGYEPPEKPPPVCNSVEGARYRDRLLAYIDNAQRLEKVDDFIATLIDCMPHYETGKGMFQAQVQLTNEEIEKLIVGFFEHEQFFHKLKRELDRNFREQEHVPPLEYKGDNCAWDYLKNTPLLRLETRQRSIDLKHRTHHHMIVAGSGHGKTTAIQYMIAQDLKEDCTILVIDNQRQMIPKLANLDLPVDDVTYISPRHNLGINLFDVDYKRLKNSEEAINATGELLEYALAGLMGAELTPKQQLIFQYAIQLTIAVPKANIHTFLEILQPKGWVEYADVLDDLPKIVRDFFHDEFDDEKQFGSTKKEIAWRIWGMLKNPTFARIFSAEENPFVMEDELEDARLILIDTDQRTLGKQGSSFFGRLFIAMMLQAARRRNEKQSRPVYAYIDEAPIYFDANLEEMLQQARKGNIGLVLAWQELEQARSRGLLSAIIGNTAIKFAGGVSDHDARYLAANMRCDYGFIKDQEQLNLAASIQGQGTYSVRVPVGEIEKMPKRNNLKELVAVMEEEYGYGEDEEPDAPEPPEGEDDEEIEPSEEM